MRAFDVLTKAEFDIRASMQPRYHLEMALLRWIHLRKLVPLTDLIEQMRERQRGAASASRQPAAPASAGRPAPTDRPSARPRRRAPSRRGGRRPSAPATVRGRQRSAERRQPQRQTGPAAAARSGGI